MKRNARQPFARLKVSKSGSSRSVVPDYLDETTGWHALMHALGTDDPDFAHGLVHQLAGTASADQTAINFLLSVIKNIVPRDHSEAMLAAQMAAVHQETMASASRLRQAQNMAQVDNAERSFSRLSRTFIAQLNALKQYRTGGEQKVTVHHVSVAEGGQAIVGNVAPNPPSLTDCV
jgi:hypothetical protein